MGSHRNLGHLGHGVTVFGKLIRNFGNVNKKWKPNVRECFSLY